MENKIHMVNWFLTRKCNMSCDYCRISRNYNNPKEYPDLKHYIKNEMDTKYIIESLRRLKQHNPEMFHCFLGGEPFLRKDLPEIINFCNRADILYTITTNSTLDNKIDELLDKVNYLYSISFSIDPDIIAIKNESLNHMISNDDAHKKSSLGLDQLLKLKGNKKINDLTADVVVTEHNKENLIPLLKLLTKMNVTTNINIVSPGINDYYDFSNISNDDILLKRNKRTKEIFEEIKKSNYKYLMGPTYIDVIYDSLPNKVDCKLEEGVHNLSVDADGSIRLCNMVRGTFTSQYKLMYYININGSINNELLENITLDKRNYCVGCSWVCIQMSKVVEDGIISSDKLANK